MKKFKILFSILILSLVFVACDNKKDTKNETTEETKIESTKERSVESDEETKDESVEETKTESTVETESDKETKQETTEETKSESVEESKQETTDETKEEKIVEVLEDEKDDVPTVIETVNVSESNEFEFNNKMTEEMRTTIKKHGLTLLSNGKPVDQFPTEDLQAIASYTDSQSYGWVVRYGKNKIGLAQKYNEAANHVPFVMFDGRGIFETTEDIIQNDSPEEFKQKAQEIIKKQIPGDAKIEYAY